MSSRRFAAHPVRITWWAEDRSVEHRFCASLVALDGGPDEVLVDEHRRVVALGTVGALQDRARALGHELVVDRPRGPDVDVVGSTARVVRRPTEADCAALDDAWSFLAEVSRSTGRIMGFRGRDAETAGRTILWGSGVLRPASAPPWTPVLSDRERRKLHQVLRRGTSNLARVIGSTGTARFERLTAAVNEADPAGLVAMGCPYYEYRPEVDDLLALTEATPQDVQAVFDRWFDGLVDLAPGTAQRLAAAARQG
ncbi:hypothetical protein AERO_11665 [Aeromicrobium fastidiosum]|uniref:hypothetical protein n=1 Tax=Aeromicrobium fastidiosum TaxID=52699 RepID=UPI0020231A76|nr:hypothetical protein [Aeromicrobium fastidiosum]MCL8252042.1 hypothetical protein [Aeromicrobium fastidiosum]